MPGMRRSSTTASIPPSATAASPAAPEAASRTAWPMSDTASARASRKRVVVVDDQHASHGTSILNVVDPSLRS